MVNVNKLKGKMVEKGMSVADLAKIIKMDKSTLYRKLGDTESFLIREVNAITKALKLTPQESIGIFFDQSVA